MPLPNTHPVVLNGAPLTPPPSSGPHKPNLAIQARLAPELIAAIIDARKRGLQLQFEAYGPNAGFHIDGQHFPIHSVAAERTPHEVYAYSALPQPELQVIGKVIGRCCVQRTLREEDQEKLLQSRSAAENASTRTIGRLDVPDVPVKGGAKRKTAVRKNVLTAGAVATALRASPAPGTAGNSPPPGVSPRTTSVDGRPNAFQMLLIHHLAYAPSTLQRLATVVKRQPKEIRGCLDSIATNDDSTTGPRPDTPTWTLKPSAYQYLRLAPPNGSASSGPWLTLTPEDTKRIIADANRAFDQLNLPPDAPPRLALAAQKPALPPTAPPAPSAKPSDNTTTTLKHPLPARPTAAVAGISNGRLDIPKPSRVASPAVVVPEVAASPRETTADAPRAPPVRAPIRAPAVVKDKSKVIEGEAEPAKEAVSVKKNGVGSKSKTAGTNGKEKSKSKIKSKAIIPADEDGEDFVRIDWEKERKLPPPAPTPTPVPPPARVNPVAPVLHSRAASSSSSRHTGESTGTAGTKRAKRDADIAALELEREIDVHDSGFAESSRPVVPSAKAPQAEGKKRRVNEEARVRAKDVGKERVKGAVKEGERLAKSTSKDVLDVKRKRREVDQESDTSYDIRDVEKKKKRRTDPAAPPPLPPKRLPREREGDTSTTEARPKKSLPTREPNPAVRVKEKPRKPAPGNANGAPVSSSTAAKTNGSNKKERASVMYTSSEDEGTPPAPRRAAPPTATASSRSSKPPAPSPSEGSTPRERERDRERDRRKPALGGGGIVLPPKRPPLPPNASAADVRDRYSEVYADYMGLNARLSAERVKVQRLLKDMDEGDHDAVLDVSAVEILTKAYREAHEELVALKVRPGLGHDP